VRKHTTLNIDTELLAEAQEVLGTTQATEAIHRALAEVVNRQKRRQLASLTIPGLTLESIEESRRGRTFDNADVRKPA
jgi:Arc/MetJ family transcription regulator